MVVWTTPNPSVKHIKGITGIIYQYKWIIGIISNNQMVVSTHLKNMLVKMGSSSPKFGVKQKYLKPPTSFNWWWLNQPRRGENYQNHLTFWHCYWEGEIDPTYTFTSISSFGGWVGGWTNQPIWKILYSYIVKLDHFPQFFQVKKTNIFEVSPPFVLIDGLKS